MGPQNCSSEPGLDFTGAATLIKERGFNSRVFFNDTLNSHAAFFLGII